MIAFCWASSFGVGAGVGSAGSAWTAIKTTTATSYTDTSAKTGVTYQYTVRAYNGNFKGWFVDSVSIKR